MLEERLRFEIACITLRKRIVKFLLCLSVRSGLIAPWRRTSAPGLSYGVGRTGFCRSSAQLLVEGRSVSGVGNNDREQYLCFL
jgi:hypothetical protein